MFSLSGHIGVAFLRNQHTIDFENLVHAPTDIAGQFQLHAVHGDIDGEPRTIATGIEPVRNEASLGEKLQDPGQDAGAACAVTEKQAVVGSDVCADMTRNLE